MNHKETQALTRLESAVLDILREETEDYDMDEKKMFYHDVFQNGVVSGCITDLIWDEDINEFFETHKAEIGSTLAEMRAGYGWSSAFNWEARDPFCNEIESRRWVVWAVFEYVTQKFYFNKVY